MNNEQKDSIIKIRMEQSREFLDSAKILLDNGSYKSANNRSYYALEKAVNAALIKVESSPKTHVGIIREFNRVFVFEGDGYFTQEDNRVIQKIQQMRNYSDYDDFYLADRESSEWAWMEAEKVVNKIAAYLEEER